MANLWNRRLQKLNWARNHPDKTRAANLRWRQIHRERYNRAAAERMRRYRARRRVTGPLVMAKGTVST